MRLSEWRAAAPHKDAATPKVAAVVDPVLAALGAGADPHGWIAWGEEPHTRYAVLVPIDPGLIVCFVRVNVPGEGPRATTKLVRWSRVTLGELSLETQAGHRLLSFQVEGQILRGVDEEADRVAGFALQLFAAMDGRPMPDPPAAAARRKPTGAAGKGAAATTRPAGKSAAPARTSAPAAAATKRLTAGRAGSKGSGS